MSSVLQQTLRGLCFDTGWCYAVFWKLKRQARPVLTWEDAFYGSKGDDTNANLSSTTISGLGQQASAGLADMEDPIAVSVSKMSYHVYSVGEGIIGRVAFTNKHQWAFSSNDKGTATDGAPNRKANLRGQSEKYPSGWDQQFAAGIKTIAVIAVPQGVVQLGSTRVITEDSKLIGHVKALFGTLQNVPGAFLSDLVTEVQRGGIHTMYPVAVPAPQMILSRTPSLPATLSRTSSLPVNMSYSTAGVGRLPRFLASQQQMLTHAHSMPSPSVLGFPSGVSYMQHPPCDTSVLGSISNSSFCTLQPSCKWAGPEEIRAVKMGVTPVVKPPTPISIKANTRLGTGIIRQSSLSAEASSMALPAATGSLFTQAVYSPYSTGSSVTGGKGINVEGPDQFTSNPPPRSGVIRHLSLNPKASPVSIPATTCGAPFPQAAQSPYSVNSAGAGGKGVNAEDFEQAKANPPPQTGVIRQLSLKSRVSSIALPAATGAPPQASQFPYSVSSASSGGKGVIVEDFKQMRANPPPGTGVIGCLSSNSKSSNFTLPPALFPQAPPSSYSAHSATAGATGLNVEDSEQLKANPPPRTGIIQHLSLSSKASPIVIPAAAGAPFPPSPCSVNSVASRSKGVNVPKVDEFDQLRAQNKLTPRMESPSAKKMLVAAESGGVRFSIESPNLSLITTKDDSLSMAGRTWSENTQSMVCGSGERPVVGVRVSLEQSSGRPFERSPHLGHGRLCTEGVEPDNSRHSDITQQSDSCRSSTECGEVKHGQALILDRGSHMVSYAQPGTRSSSKKAGPQLDNPLPPAECSAMKRTQLLARSSTLESEHLGVTAIQEDAFEGSELPTRSDTNELVSLPLSTSCALKQDSHEKELGGVNAKGFSSLPCEEITSESGHLTMQMYDLLELAQQFESADSEGYNDFPSVNVKDAHQSLSSSLLCDDYFESMQFLKPLFQSSEGPAGDSGPADYPVHSLFSTELDEFDEFFASLTKAEEGKSGVFSQPEKVCDARSNNEVLGYLNLGSWDAISKRKEMFTSSNTESVHGASMQADYEPLLGIMAANQPLPGLVANEVTLPEGKELANPPKDLQVDRFVNSRTHPEVSLPCSRLHGDTDLGCQEMAALSPPGNRHRETRKKREKRLRPGNDDAAGQSKSRQKMQDRIQELRAIVPDGARCGIDTLLGKALEYARALQMVSHDSGEGTTPTIKLQSHDGGTGVGVGSEAPTSFDASWVVDLNVQEKACPIVVESLSQPGQMLVEMLCEEHAKFLKIADILKGLGFTISKGVMEARSNSIWARFVIKGPKEIHRVQVLWSLMHMLGSCNTS